MTNTHATPWLIMLDFDGTLVDHAVLPSQIRPDPTLLTLLAALAKRHEVFIITGRRAQDIALLLDYTVPVYGLHGLDSPLGPPPKRSAAFDAIRAELGAVARRFAGFHVEDKHAILALHFRPVAPHEKQDAWRHAESILAPHIANMAKTPEPLRTLYGNEVIEVAPAHATKKQTVRDLLASFPNHYPLYIGDDVPDEEAMALLKDHGLAIRVSKKPCATHAAMLLESPQDVLAFLSQIAFE